MKNANKGVKGFVKIPLEDRFWSKVDKSKTNEECWIWTGSNDGKGYGQIWVDGKVRKATKVSWELKNKIPFPEGMEACHSCDNPRCVNPDHIWPGTHKENMRDSIKKGRFVSIVSSPLKWIPKKKTHCPKGHEYTEENTYINPRRGGKICRTCHRKTQLAYLKKVKDSQKLEKC